MALITALNVLVMSMSCVALECRHKGWGVSVIIGVAAAGGMKFTVLSLLLGAFGKVQLWQ